MELLELSWDTKEDVDKFYHKMTSKVIRKEVTMTGDVIIMANVVDKLKDSTITIVGCIFLKDGTIKNLSQTLEFDENAKVDVVNILDDLLRKQHERKDKVQQELDQLPKNLQDDSKLNEVLQKIQDLEDRKDNIYSAAVYDDDLLVVQCGRYIKHILINESMFNGDPDSVNEF